MNIAVPDPPLFLKFPQKKYTLMEDETLSLSDVVIEDPIFK
jgi:hypothetical protein